MAIITRTSHKVWTGAPATIQRAPSPLRTRGHRARGGEEKEIEVISTAKEVTRAREPGRGHAPHWDDVLAGAVFQAQQKVDINGLVSFVKESGLRNREGEAGYILSRLTGTAFEPGDLDSLKPELKDWFNEQLANMEEVLEKAKREIEKRIRKLKARGDYTSADILRIKTAEYPKWTTQYIEASKKLQKVKAKGGPEAVATEQAKAFAKVRAKTAGVDSIDLSEKQIVDLKKASPEKAIEESLKLGLNAEQLMAIRATPKSERDAFAEAYETREKGITIAPEIVEKPIVTIEATAEETKKAEESKAAAKAQGWSCYTQLSTYKVRLKDGTTVLVEALSDSSAKQKAKDAGHTPTSATRMMSWETIEPTKTPTGAFNVTGEDGETITMVPLEHRETGETLLISRDSATELKGTQAYKDAKGTDEQKLGIAFAIQQENFEHQLQENFPDLYTTYKEEGVEAYNQAFEKWEQEFINNLKKESPELYDTYTEGGWGALAESIGQQNEEYADFQAKIESGELIALPDDTYITKEEFDKQTKGTQQILREGGFAALEVATAMKYEKKGKPSETLPRYITREEYRNLNVIDRALYSPAPGYGPRAGVELAVAFIPPIKATLPEYTLADVSTTDWLLAGANVVLLPAAFGPGALTGAVASAGRMAAIGRGVSIAASGIISGVVGYETAKHWDELTPAQRGFGIGIATLCAIPILTTVARNVKITASPSIPTTKGNVVTWKGLSVAGYPIIGRSGGKWILGTRNLTIPEARLILDGYHPQMLLETKVFVNQAALAKAGFTKTQIDYLIKTLKSRNLFTGKTSPWLDKNVLIEPTEHLTANEINIVMKHITNKPGQVKNAKLLYGSPTIKAQAAPELRNWRPLHDWDISVSGSQANAEAFTRSLLDDLKAAGGGKYRISPKSPTLIEKQIKGQWTHIADIHPYDIGSVDIPASRLDTTGTYSYGRMVSEPAITIDYPGVGKLRIMRLSETGVRKSDTILRVRQTPEGTAFRPPARGIAQPGVPKDAADFYVTLRTLTDKTIAEDWLASWAKAMGYTDAQLAKVLPRIRTAMLEVAANTPADIIGYEFTPAGSAIISAGATPSIIVHIPSSLGASISTALAKRISQPIYPYKLAQSPSIQKIVTSAYPSVSSKIPSKYPFISKSPALPSIPTSKFIPLSSPSISAAPSPSLSPSPALSPSPSPSVGPSPSPAPSPAPSPTVGPSPSPAPSPAPSPMLTPGPKPRLERVSTTSGRTRIPKPGESLVSWRQGCYFVTIVPPYRTTGTKPDVIYSRHRPPWAKVVKGRGSPQRSLKAIGGVPSTIKLPMGVVTARVKNGRRLKFSSD